MAVISTDDAARNLRFNWLGPKGFRLIAAPPAAYAVAFLLASTGIVVTWMTRPSAGVWLFIECPAVVVGALLITRAIFRNVDQQQNLRYWKETLTVELRTPRPPGDAGLSTRTRVAPHLFTRHERHSK